MQKFENRRTLACPQVTRKNINIITKFRDYHKNYGALLVTLEIQAEHVGAVSSLVSAHIEMPATCFLVALN